MNANQTSRNDNRLQALRRRSFTLVEMMVVIVIVAIVMGVAIPSFVHLTSGSAVRGGTRLLAAQLRLTRQFAISQRRTVALLLPGEIKSGGVNRLPAELCYVAMKPAIVAATGAGNVFTFVEWVDGAKWLFIPRGAVVAEVDADKGISSGGNFSVTAPVEDSGCSVNVPFAELKDLDEGLTSYSGDATIRALVFSPTGRVKGLDEADVTVAQLLYVNGSWISKTPGTSGTSSHLTANQFNIEINVYTGRIKVESPSGLPSPAY